jgi:hypothetical protein
MGEPADPVADHGEPIDREAIMNDQNRELQERIEALEQEVAELRQAAHLARPKVQTIRRRSTTICLGMPLWEIALGPDPEHGELRGHARAVFAIGDIATGVFALGGIARGVCCLGGISLGCFTIGGVSLSLLLAFGGVAIAPVALGGVAVGGLAMGGVAAGGAASGGAAIGFYAKGSAAVGKFIVSAMRQDPEAVQFFAKWLPWL